eukprot:CAMPEP_0115318900 /NCGR_PEP_ID=MMETSP0270-20121206/79456_1 /TAXON_ID=71861 /ORGANISM="Scrippsiella trochoidea, Strain CCMP3099" /LENGTH=347 /DNA_ID=CAMNT_0002738511 /DNA_START=11 /DNA_END=1052 /DNA_ORIENTATION=+
MGLRGLTGVASSDPGDPSAEPREIKASPRPAMLRLLALFAGSATVCHAEAAGSPWCQQGLRAQWTEERRDWCCEHEGLGCDPPARRLQDMCEMKCFLQGIPATCRSRVQWASEHKFNFAPDACSQAHALVLHECEVCSGCGLPELCGVHRSLALQQVVTTPLPQPATTPLPQPVTTLSMLATTTTPAPTTTPRTTSTSMAYDCTGNDQIARAVWSDEKREWCCLHHAKGCPVGLMPTATSTTSVPPSTTTTSQTQTTSITTSETITTSPSTSTTTSWTTTRTLTRTASTTTSSTSTAFDCATAALRAATAAGALSPERQEWCCLHHARACPGQPLERGQIPHGYDCS